MIILLTGLEFLILLYRITREEHAIFSISIIYAFEVNTYFQSKEIPLENKLFVLANVMYA